MPPKGGTELQWELFWNIKNVVAKDENLTTEQKSLAFFDFLIEDSELRISMIFFLFSQLWKSLESSRDTEDKYTELQYFLRSREHSVTESVTHFCELSTHSSISN